MLGLLPFQIQAAADSPIIDSIEPAEMVEGVIPQPELVITGENFLVGLPNDANRPTVTLLQEGVAEFSARGFVNVSGTTVTLPSEELSLIGAPTGAYDVTVARPDGEFDTLIAGFTIISDEPGPGEIGFVFHSAWGGPVNDVFVEGNIAYLARGRQLVILDVSDLAEPVEVGSLYIPSGVTGVAVRDGFAFLAAGDPYRFAIVDVTDSANPVLVDVVEDASHDVHLYGDFAFVRAGQAGCDLDLIDISQPTSSSLVGRVISSIVSDVVVLDDLLYIGANTGELQIYDVSVDPLKPTFLGSCASGGTETVGLAVEGDYAVWAVRHDIPDGEPDEWNMHVVDVSNAEAPQITGVYENGAESEFRDVVMAGGLAYLADAGNTQIGAVANWADAEGLMIFDITSDPAAPALLGTFKTHGNVTGVRISGSTAYVMDEGAGLLLIDISEPTQPQELGRFHSPAALRRMARSGDLLFVSDRWGGFTVLDAAHPGELELLGFYEAEHVDGLGVDAEGIAVKDDVVFLAAGHLGLEAIDVSDPTSPQRIGALRIPPPAIPAASLFTALALVGDVAHVGTGESFGNGVATRFRNIDIKTPQRMLELGLIGNLSGPYPPGTIAPNGAGVAFVAQDDPAALTIDTTDVWAPEVIHTSQLSPVGDVALVGDILYLAVWDDQLPPAQRGLFIQDVTDPEDPVLLAAITESTPLGLEGVLLMFAYAVKATADRAYVVAGDNLGAGYLIAFDTTDPTEPIALDFQRHVGTQSSSNFSGILVDEPYVYVANQSQGPHDPSIGMVVMELRGLNSADLDNDGVVGTSDLLILLGSWGQCPPKGACLADIDGDGVVGTSDLLIVLGSWG